MVDYVMLFAYDQFREAMFRRKEYWLFGGLRQTGLADSSFTADNVVSIDEQSKLLDHWIRTANCKLSNFGLKGRGLNAPDPHFLGLYQLLSE